MIDVEIIEIYEAIFLAMFGISAGGWLAGFWYTDATNNDGRHRERGNY